MNTDKLETLWHITVLSNLARGYDKYARVYSKEGIPESTFPNRFFLLRETELSAGIREARGLLERLAIPGNRLLALRTVVPVDALKENTRTDIGRYVESSRIPLDGVAWVDDEINEIRLAPVSIEDASALSFRLLRSELLGYAALLRPRTFSVLPVARGCQAACPFCFSEASVSAEQEQARLNLLSVRRFAESARKRGAKRFVITGGGEPGLVRHEQLLELIRVGREALGKPVLITNGHHLSRHADGNRARVLAVSRHRRRDTDSKRLMNLHTDASAIARTC